MSRLPALIRLLLSLLIALGVVVRILPTGLLLGFLGDPRTAVARPAFWALRYRRSRHPGVIDALLLSTVDCRPAISTWAVWAVQNHGGEIHRALPRFHQVAQVAASDRERIGLCVLLADLALIAETEETDRWPGAHPSATAQALIRPLIEVYGGSEQSRIFLAASVTLITRISQTDGVASDRLLALLHQVPQAIIAQPQRIETSTLSTIQQALTDIARRLAWRQRSSHLKSETVAHTVNEVGLLLFQVPHRDIQTLLQTVLHELQAVPTAP